MFINREALGWNSVFYDALCMWNGLYIVLFGRFEHLCMIFIFFMANNGPMTLIIIEHAGRVGMPLLDRDRFDLHI